MVYPQEAGHGSIFEDARHYFSSAPEQEKQIQTLKERKRLFVLLLEKDLTKLLKIQAKI